MDQLKKTSSFSDIDIHQYDWIIDKAGRMMVVLGFWYENNVKYRVQILELGKSTIIDPMPLYMDVQAEIFKANMRFFIK